MNDQLHFVRDDDPLDGAYQDLVSPLCDDVTSLQIDCEKRMNQLAFLLSTMTRYFNSEEANYSFVVSHTVAELQSSMFMSKNVCSQNLLRKILLWCRTICLSQDVVRDTEFRTKEFQRKLQYLFIVSLDVFAQHPRDDISLEFFIDNLKRPETAWITFCAFEEIESFDKVLRQLWIASGKNLSDFPEDNLQQFIAE